MAILWSCVLGVSSRRAHWCRVVTGGDAPEHFLVFCFLLSGGFCDDRFGFVFRNWQRLVEELCERTGGPVAESCCFRVMIVKRVCIVDDMCKVQRLFSCMCIRTDRKRVIV